MGLSTDVLRAIHGGVFRLDALAGHLGRDKRAIVKAVQVLKRRGLARIHSVSFGGDLVGANNQSSSYELTEAGQDQALSGVPVSPGQGQRPRKKTVGLRERAWWELRAHGLASLKQITTTHAEGNEKAADMNLYKYLAALEKAGILTRSCKNLPARQGKGRVQWLLAIDLGPKAPVWRQLAQEVFDPNTGKAYPMARVGDES